MKTYMKIIAVILLVSVMSGIAQDTDWCRPGFVCTPQATANEVAQRLRELIEARNVIAKFAEERAANATERGAALAERDAALALIKRVDQLIAIDDKIIDRYTKFVDKAWEVLDLQSKLIEKLIARIDKPKSAWSKFLSALEKLGSIALGIALGRGFR